MAARSPTPPPELYVLRFPGFFERSIAAIAVQGIAFGVPKVRLPELTARGAKGRIANQSLPDFCPHVRHIQIGPAIAVVVEPARAHARAQVFDAGRGGHVLEMTVLVAI